MQPVLDKASLHRNIHKIGVYIDVLSCSCPTLCDSMNCSLPGSSVHGILQARTLEWVAISYSRGSSQPMDQTHVSCISCIGRQILYHCATWEAPQGSHSYCLLSVILLSPLAIPSSYPTPSSLFTNVAHLLTHTEAHPYSVLRSLVSLYKTGSLSSRSSYIIY